MNKTNRYLKLISSCFILYFVIITIWAVCFGIESYVDAAHVIYTEKSVTRVQDGNGGYSLIATMDHSSIQIVAYNHRATNVIRWRTI